VQLVLLAASTAQAPLLCTAAPLASPTAQRTTHTVYSVVGALARMAAVPAPAAAVDNSNGSNSMVECVTLLTWWVGGWVGQPNACRVCAPACIRACFSESDSYAGLAVSIGTLGL